MKSRYFLFFGFALGLIAVAIAGTVLVQRPYSYQGSLIEPPTPAADFELIQPDGQTFRLSEQRGKVVLIFFGYTHCPDVCPVTLSEFKQIRQKLGKRAVGVAFLFITVDPKRDTPEALGKHLALFDPAIIGLTGDFYNLQVVWKAYGVTREEQEVSGVAEYLVDHTARTYVVDKRGDLRMTYPFGFDADGMAQDVEHLVDEELK